MYLLNVNWGWIKQRPQYLAEELARYYDVDVFQKKEYRQKINIKCVKGNLRIAEIFRFPFESNNIISWLNYHIISKQLNKLISNYDIIWLSDASFFSAMNVPINKLVIYDCMDDNIEFPYIKYNVIKKKRFLIAEKELLERANICFFSSYYLQDVVSRRTGLDLSCKSIVLNNAIDKREKRCDIESRKRKEDTTFHIAYIGTISSWFDFDIIEYSLSNIPNIAFDLYGPLEVELPVNDRIVYHGVLNHDDIFDAMKKADLLVMPFKKTPLVMSVNPVKLYEYIESGKPSLAIRYKETENFSRFVSLYETREEFVEKVKEWMERESKISYSLDEINEFIRKNTWEERGKVINKVIKDECCGKYIGSE